MNWLTIWRDVFSVTINRKFGRAGFHETLGDLPVITIGKEGKALIVENSRGLAYAHRNDKRYMPTKAERVEKERKRKKFDEEG